MASIKRRDRVDAARFALLLAELSHVLAFTPPGTLPKEPNRTFSGGWSTVGYILGNPLPRSILTKRVPITYGCVAKRVLEETSADGSTNTITEYAVLLQELPGALHDILTVDPEPMPHPRTANGGVVPNFFRAYQKLEFALVTDGLEPVPLMDGLKKILPVGDIARFSVAGHGVGAAIGAYLLFDLSFEINPPSSLKGWFIGPAKCGDKEFVNAVAIREIHHVSFVSDRDLMHHFPEGPYGHLRDVRYITERNAQAVIADDPAAMHDTLCYTAMIYCWLQSGLDEWRKLFVQLGRSRNWLLRINYGLLNGKMFKAAVRWVVENWDTISEIFKKTAPAASVALVTYFGSGYVVQKALGEHDKVHIGGYPPIPGTPSAPRVAEIRSPANGTLQSIVRDKTNVRENQVIALVGLDDELSKDTKEIVSLEETIFSGCEIDRNEYYQFKQEFDSYEGIEGTFVENLDAYITGIEKYTPFHIDHATPVEIKDGSKMSMNRILSDESKLNKSEHSLDQEFAKLVKCGNQQQAVVKLIDYTNEVSKLFPIEIRSPTAGIIHISNSAPSGHVNQGQVLGNITPDPN